MYYLRSPLRERFDPRGCADPAAIIAWGNPEVTRYAIENGVMDA